MFLIEHRFFLSFFLLRNRLFFTLFLSTHDVPHIVLLRDPAKAGRYGYFFAFPWLATDRIALATASESPR